MIIPNFCLKTYELQIYNMFDGISKFLKNEMFGSNNTRKGRF